MRATLDHVGIAVKDLAAALAFYRDALGLEIEPPEEVAAQRVRAHFVPVGESKLELLEATAPESAVAKYVDKRGPGLHHITLRVDDIAAAVAQVKARGVRMIDDQPRAGAEGAMVAFIHPSSAHGVLVELKQSPFDTAQGDRELVERSAIGRHALQSAVGTRESRVQRFNVGNIELISLFDGFFRLDGGSMFGTVPKTLWERQAPADDQNRVTLATRPLLVRGARTMLIDAGLGDKRDEKVQAMFAVDRRRNLDHTLAEAGVSPEDIDIVLATHLHFDHAGGFTVRDAANRLRPRFPRAQYIVRRGEWEEAARVNERMRWAYFADDFTPLADAGVLQLVDDDATIMPGVKVRRTGGHTTHHQIVTIESSGKTAVFPADLIPTTAHARDAWIMAIDLFPVESLAAKKRLAAEILERETLVFFEHDPAVAAGYFHDDNGRRRLAPAPRTHL